MKNVNNKITRSALRFFIGCTLIGSLTCCTASCDSFTETEMPITEMNENAVFEEATTATAAMTNVYSQIRDAGLLTGKATGTSKMLGLYTDELTFWGANSDDSDKFYKNTLLSNTGIVREWWNATYTQIYGSNSVIEGLEASSKLESELKMQLLGEAKFVRALLHFYLVELYGDIPYITTTDYNKNSKVTRMPKNKVLQAIINDLEEATTLLSENYPSEARVRPNVFAVKALLARVYLYKGDWAQASNSASAVLNQSDLYIWNEPLDATFLKESKGTLWQLSPRSASRNTDEALTFIFTQGPPPQVALTESLINTFETGDLRKEWWTKAVTDGSSNWYHPYKYKKQANSSPQLEYSIVLRLAEQYLIRAEARVQQGEFIGALEDLNAIRLKAGLPASTAQSKNEILTAVLKERRVELFTEYGHRFFDLKRNGKLGEALSIIKPSWNTTNQLLPLPVEELLLNDNLKPQNPGY